MEEKCNLLLKLRRLPDSFVAFLLKSGVRRLQQPLSFETFQSCYNSSPVLDPPIFHNLHYQVLESTEVEPEENIKVLYLEMSNSICSRFPYLSLALLYTISGETTFDRRQNKFQQMQDSP